MATLEFYDAAYPPSAPPAGADGVCGYIGGDALNVWSSTDWERQRARYRLPIFVRANPPGPGAEADVANAEAAVGVAERDRDEKHDDPYGNPVLAEFLRHSDENAAEDARGQCGK